MRCLLLALAAALPAAAFAGDTTTSRPIVLAQGASSCSGWKAICDSRGPGCDAKMAACMKNGCWTEGKAYGGKTHCGLAKR